VETCWTRTRSPASSKAPRPRRMSATALPTQTERHVAFISVPSLLRCVPPTTLDERRVRSLPSHVVRASRSQPGGSSEHQQCHVVTPRKCVELTIGIGGMRGHHARGHGGMPGPGREDVGARLSSALTGWMDKGGRSARQNLGGVCDLPITSYLVQRQKERGQVDTHTPRKMTGWATGYPPSQDSLTVIDPLTA